MNPDALAEINIISSTLDPQFSDNGKLSPPDAFEATLFNASTGDSLSSPTNEATVVSSFAARGGCR